MFWRFGGYANISTIDTLLEKPDFTLENLLDEADLLHEIKQHNAKLIEYLREEPVLQRLLDYVVAPKLEEVAAPENSTAADDDKGKAAQFSVSRSRASSVAASDPDEDEGEKKRNRYAYVSSEVLASDTWSIYEALIENGALVRGFWDFLKRPAPLDPLQASYFTKVNEALFEKKTEDMIEVLKSVPGAVSDLLRHVECPMIMDLLLKIIALDRTEGGQGIVEWLYSQDVIPILLSCLSPDRNWVVQTAAGDFIKAIITISANASQNEQQCIGPNELTRQLVSRDCIEQLIKYMLAGGNPLTVGVGIVIEVIRKNNSDYDPDVGADEGSTPSCRDPIYLGTLLRLFAEHVPDFMKLIMHAPTTRQDIHSTFGNRIEPLGFDRFKTCELMAELLHCSNMGLMNEVGSEELIAARDAERHRLRGDGKLVPRRDEDPSMEAEDLTMRFSQDSNRRLEVTNVAEEDGFEEVEHSREMNEDTSHEFVKAEDEIPPPVPIPSFFDKDDDELQDEPLSSPRLHIREDDLDSREFEEPDLVVAPLSPKKKGAVPEGGNAPAVPAEEAPAKEEAGTGQETKTGEETKPGETKPGETKPGETKPEQETTPEPINLDEANPELDVKPQQDTKHDPKDTTASSATPTDKDTLPSSTTDMAALDKDAKSAVPAPLSLGEPRHGDDSDSSTAVHTPATAESHSDQEADVKPAESSKLEPKVSESEPAKGVEGVSKEPAQEQPPTSSEAPAAQPAESTTSPSEPATEKAEPLPSAPAPPAPSQASEPSAQPSGSEAKDEAPGAKEDNDNANAGTESIIIGAVPDPPKEAGAPVQPVVGDFLKTQFVEHKVVPTILSFFFKYPWNNFLHNVVYDVVQQVFNGPMDRGYNPTLAVSLFESADVTNAIIEGQRRSDESQARTKTRMGYMGHLTLIAEEVVKFTERHPPEVLSETVLERVMSQDWVNYVEGALAETRERDNAILGGVRPEVAMNNRAAMSGLAGVGLSGLGPSIGGGASNALAEAGLNGSLELGEGSGGVGPFAISAGTMMSGFGSSSDEEEDENEDAEEDINNEFRSYTDPLNNNGSSPDPPSIPPPPPPPPPLNIPPSRARLQLAARLAMHQKNAAAAAAVAPLPERHEDDKEGEGGDKEEAPKDPFGDDADEVESDDEGGGGSWGAGRGGWWKDVVMRRGNLSDSDEEVDEEFGDFAMPEGGGQGSTAQGTTGLRVVKPLAVHPAGQKTGFGSLWPFSAHNFGGREKEKEEGREEKEGEGQGQGEGEGEGISRTVEAKTRTSLDDDGDDEVVV